MPSLQASFFCGSSWDDAVTSCKKRCPSGEHSECPFEEKCFSLTPCTDERGYPDDYAPPSNSDSNEVGEECVPFIVTIVADHWPKETSWTIKNTAVGGEVLAEGHSDDLKPGQAVEWVECINNKNGCYDFTIYDSGGDGMCCQHGEGSYEISYDGAELKQGAIFYDKETTTFGYCGNPPETDQPTNTPTKNDVTISGGGGQPGEVAYRCVAQPLIDAGYKIARNMCGLFVDCFNEFIQVGDDFFCDEGSACVEAPACGIDEDGQQVDVTAEPPPPPTNKPTPNTPASRPVPSQPKADPTPKPVSKPPTRAPTSKAPTLAPATASPSATPTSPTTTPTLLPTTNRPTFGPCGGARCNQENHCRSPFGFCGGGESYCNSGAIWTKDCPPPAPTQQPSNTPTRKQLPSFKKPVGGKGSMSKPKPVNTSPTPLYSTQKPTRTPIEMIVRTSSPSRRPSNQPTSSPITKSPTRDEPTASSLIQPTNAIIEVDEPSSNGEDELICSGDPCPIKSHCRSRYGSCGPGFIYW